MQNATAAGHAEESFEMSGVIPHHGGHTVPALHSKFCEGSGQTTGTAIEFAEASASNGLIRLAGDDFGAGEDFPGTLQDGGECERKIHHGAAHRVLGWERSWAHRTINRVISLGSRNAWEID